jgi:hypothetical protein
MVKKSPSQQKLAQRVTIVPSPTSFALGLFHTTQTCNGMVLFLAAANRTVTNAFIAVRDAIL